MSLHAVDDLGDALAATRAFLFPFDAGRWLRLAIVAFFVGGVGSNVPTSGFQTGGDVDPGPVDPGGPGTMPPELGGEAVTLIVAVVVALVAIGLLFGFVGSVMQFVLVRSLREEAVHVRRYFREHWRAGARLFGFQIGLGLLALAVIVVPILALVLTAGGLGAVGPGRAFGLVLLLLPLAFIVGVLFALIDGFTTFFVVPVMLLEGTGVLAAWGRFYRILRAEWKEYLAFTGLTFVLTLVVGIAVGFVVGIVALLVFGPLVLFGMAGVVSAGVFGPGGLGAASLPLLLALAGVGLLALLLVVAAAALVQVPVVTYFRYYALLVLGDTDADLDLIPERRRAVRAGSGGGGGPSDEGSGAESA
jgi:hypothetical protein